MAIKRPTPVRYIQPYRYPSPNVPLSAIRRFARQIAERFQPEKIILFGSYAYGTPHVESDVDLLVIMPAYDVVNQAVRISLAFERQFSLDLIVRTPEQIERGVREDNWFLRDITEKGKVLYEAANRPVAAQSRGRLARGARTGRPKTAAGRPGVLPLPTSSGEISQGLKGAHIPKTHDLEDLLDLLLPYDRTLARQRPGLGRSKSSRRGIPLSAIQAFALPNDEWTQLFASPDASVGSCAQD